MMEKLKTGGDVMVYLRNAALGIVEVIKNTDAERITVNVSKDGYVYVQAGAYEYVHIDGLMEKYRYTPLGEVAKWQNVQPGQIAGLTEPPEEQKGMGWQ